MTEYKLETQRLWLREFTLDDAAFVKLLVNEPAWKRYIGNSKVETLEQARAYIQRGLLAAYASYGYGLYLMARKPDGLPVGMCGLVRREGLDHADVGFALLAAHRGSGYAREAVSATLAHGEQKLGLDKILAITNPDNRASIAVLEQTGMCFERRLRLKADGEELALYSTPGKIP